jgi:hypothetical protein
MAREFSTGSEERVDPGRTFIMKRRNCHVNQAFSETFVHGCRQSGFAIAES